MQATNAALSFKFTLLSEEVKQGMANSAIQDPAIFSVFDRAYYDTSRCAARRQCSRLDEHKSQWST